MLSQQDEKRLKELFGTVHVLIEGLQAQITDLKEELANLKVATPMGPQPVVATKKAKAVVEEPVVETKPETK
jgi:hypothetical protein